MRTGLVASDELVPKEVARLREDDGLYQYLGRSQPFYGDERAADLPQARDLDTYA